MCKPCLFKVIICGCCVGCCNLQHTTNIHIPTFTSHRWNAYHTNLNNKTICYSWRTRHMALLVRAILCECPGCYCTVHYTQTHTHTHWCVTIMRCLCLVRLVDIMHVCTFYSFYVDMIPYHIVSYGQNANILGLLNESDVWMRAAHLSVLHKTTTVLHKNNAPKNWFICPKQWIAFYPVNQIE